MWSSFGKTLRRPTLEGRSGIRKILDSRKKRTKRKLRKRVRAGTWRRLRGQRRRRSWWLRRERQGICGSPRLREQKKLPCQVRRRCGKGFGDWCTSTL